MFAYIFIIVAVTVFFLMRDCNKKESGYIDDKFHELKPSHK